MTSALATQVPTLGYDSSPLVLRAQQGKLPRQWAASFPSSTGRAERVTVREMRFLSAVGMQS